MTAQHQLEATLRTLKLSGMLDTLDARLGQARAGELGHLSHRSALSLASATTNTRPNRPCASPW